MTRLIALTIAIATFASQASGFVLSGQIEQQTGSGTFEKLSTETPFDVGDDNFDTCNLYAFDEDQNILLVEPIRVDIGGENGFIKAGTVVASHYVFFDSIDGFHSGHVDFDAPVLGIAAYQGTMGATDFLANTSVNYISTELRGLERGDYVWIDADDPHRIWVSWAGSSPGDYIRVFTARSPGV